MYSAYLQSMALLYHYIFNDDRYAQPGALTMELKPLYWGAGENPSIPVELAGSARASGTRE